jgi:hypothetical protein
MSLMIIRDDMDMEDGGFGLGSLIGENAEIAMRDDRDLVFAREYVRLRALKSKNPAELACVRAGITNPEYHIKVVAERQLARAEVQRLIAEAEASGLTVERTEYTRDLFLDELQAVHERALDARNFTSAISAVKTQAQLLGFMDQTVNINHTVTAKDLDLATLRAMVADRAKPVNVIEGTVVDVE